MWWREEIIPLPGIKRLLPNRESRGACILAKLPKPNLHVGEMNTIVCFEYKIARKESDNFAYPVWSTLVFTKHKFQFCVRP
jgi:hypothetical protein